LFFSAILYKIADHVLCNKENLDSNEVKYLWFTGTLEKTNELDLLDKPYPPPIDCGAFTEYSIIQHLENHSSFEIESECECGTFYHRDCQLQVDKLEEIEYLGNPKNLARAQLPICSECEDFRVLKNLRPFEQNWLLTIQYVSDENPSPRLSEIPRLVQMGDIVYKLEYASYILELGPSVHCVSMHYIRHSWHLYDALMSPKFKRWRKPSLDFPQAKLTRLVYFKVL